MNMILLLCLCLALFLPYNHGVNPSCECITFDGSHDKSEGVFTSPNFPTPYEDNINCLLYTFIGRQDEIIQLTFDEFDLQRIDNMDCVFGDFVKLFLHLQEAKVNEYTRWNGVMCGSIQDVERTHYSSNNSLIFEFHSDWRHSNHTGFKGTYKFINRKAFQIDGDKLSGTDCDYQFVSTNRTMSVGRFYSPRYPSNYPKYSRCSYRFLGRYGERVRVVFEKVSLRQGDSSCLHSPEDIVVHDGKDNSASVIGQLCNANRMVEVVSTGSDLYIEFSSRSHDPGQGFEAMFAFEDEATSTFVGRAVDIPSTEPDKNSDPQEKKVVEEEEVDVTTQKISSVDCDVRITSDVAKNGSISSPNFPRPYPQNVRCTYNFTGRGKERVQLIFTDFDLFKAEENTNCETVDVVMIFIILNGKSERIDNFCGHKMPEQLMSNGPVLTLEFLTLSSPGTSQGFNAIYKFVTNFGVTSGKQDSQSVCGFVYNSSEVVNGSFTSPNYPGFYPRDTECHYFFYGRQNERVRITFPYFDVEGVTPCTFITASDYVEFSNFKTVDRKIPRHCGMKKPTVIESEGDFFRVTFKSNDKFDGTGFEAFYQFKSHEDPYTIKRVRGSPNDGSCHCRLPFVVLLAAIYVFI